VTAPPGAGPLVHLVAGAEWERVRSTGTPYWPPGADDAGFVHLSAPSQVHLPAQRIFPGRTDVVLLVIDATRLRAPLRWEEGDPPEGDLRFPHLYGPLDLDAVVRVVPYRPGADGRFAPLAAEFTDVTVTPPP
jgi:uncharacterized protein (DUF952 family)